MRWTRRAAELEQQAQALDDAPEWSPDEAEMIDLEEQDIAARRKAIHEALKTWTPEQKAHAGVIVTIGRDGDVEVMRGLVRDEDRKAIAAAVRSKGATEHRGADDARDEDEGSPSLSAAPERRAPGCSDALTKRLAAHRTMALQAMLAQNTAVALASVVHVFVLRTFGADYPREASALQVTPQLSAFALEAMADDLKASRAWQAVQQAKEAWRARLPEDQGEWFGWLIGLPQAELIDLLALCGALTVNALPGAGAAGSANAIAAALGLDMADWWEPTAEALPEPRAEGADHRGAEGGRARAGRWWCRGDEEGCAGERSGIAAGRHALAARAAAPIARLTGSRGRGEPARAIRVGGVMWLLVAREPRPDAPDWPGRRLLAAVDAVVVAADVGAADPARAGAGGPDRPVRHGAGRAAWARAPAPRALGQPPLLVHDLALGQGAGARCC